MDIKPEELSLEGIKVQIALFQRLYYQKMKQVPEFVGRKNEKARVWNARRRERERQLRPPKEKVEKPKTEKQPKKPPINDCNRKYYDEEIKVLPPDAVAKKAHEAQPSTVRDYLQTPLKKQPALNQNNN